MNEIEKVLSFFKTAEDWNSFVELSNMKDMMGRELKSRLLTEMRIIAESNLSGAGWKYDAKDDYISIVLHNNNHHTLEIRIEWQFWTCLGINEEPGYGLILLKLLLKILLGRFMAIPN